VEERGKLEGGPSSTLPCDEPEAQSLAIEEETIPEDPLASLQSTGHDDSIWEDLAKASAAAEEFMGEPEAPLGPSLQPRQATLLDFVHPHWLQGEAGISTNVQALIHDHGMDYSAGALDHALAWLLLQRCDIAAYLRAWLARCMQTDQDPRKVLRDLNFHLLALEQA